MAFASGWYLLYYYATECLNSNSFDNVQLFTLYDKVIFALKVTKSVMTKSDKEIVYVS